MVATWIGAALQVDSQAHSIKFLDNEEIAAILDAPMNRIFDAYAGN